MSSGIGDRTGPEFDDEPRPLDGEPTPNAVEIASAARQTLQERLFAAGLLGEIKPAIVDMTPWMGRKAVPIEGEPISETIIRERR